LPATAFDTKGLEMNGMNGLLQQRLTRLAFAFMVAVALGACSSVGPYNSISDGADSVLMLKGHDPVAYFTLDKLTLGKPEIKATHEGATYRFASEEHKAMFSKDPAKYAPQFGGYCSNGVVYGMAFGGDADTWKVIDGKLYIFGGAGSRKYFLMDEKKNLQLANQYWSSELKGSSGIMRYYRLVARVPHYKTGAQLEAEWQQAQSGKPQGVQ
jgi:YHS domain-containing protein